MGRDTRELGHRRNVPFRDMLPGVYRWGSYAKLFGQIGNAKILTKSHRGTLGTGHHTLLVNTTWHLALVPHRLQWVAVPGHSPPAVRGRMQEKALTAANSSLQCTLPQMHYALCAALLYTGHKLISDIKDGPRAVWVEG